MLALRKVSVHAYEDPGRPEGGHAVVLLHGVSTSPDNVAFRLKPTDTGPGTDMTGWPHGELTPIACRTTPEGLEVQIGPDVTESELLLPGTLVEIELAGAGVRGEFMWPNIAPVLRPRKRTVIVNNPRRAKDVGRDPGGPAMDAARRAAAVQSGADIVLPGGTDPDHAAGHIRLERDPAAQPSASAALAAMALTEGIAETMTTPSEADSVGKSAAEQPAAPTSTGPTKTPADVVPTLRGGHAMQPPLATGSPSPTPSAEPHASPAGDDPAFYPHARAGRAAAAAPATPPRTEPANRRASNAFQAVAGLLAVVAALYVLSRESSMRTVAPQPPADGGSIVLPSSTTAPAPTHAQAGAPVDHPSLYDTLGSGAVSPRGSKVAGTSPMRALENANAQLSGVDRDTEEAAFWLRRYITGTLGNDRTTRALTQLGSVYAEPVGGAAPDYGKARMLWELASAAGDPVAMCFLGLLSENGLGISLDRGVALQWYERSKQAGGCPQVDASIARVKQ